MEKGISAIGRRKQATARVLCYHATEQDREKLSFKAPEGDESSAPNYTGAMIIVNDRPFNEYFSTEALKDSVVKPLLVTERIGNYRFRVNVRGGGVSGQAGAIVLGIARILETLEGDLRPSLKKEGLLTRDPRAVERKKFGRHKARRSTQFSKR